MTITPYRMRSQSVSERRNRGADEAGVPTGDDDICGYWIMAGRGCQRLKRFCRSSLAPDSLFAIAFFALFPIFAIFAFFAFQAFCFLAIALLILSALPRSVLSWILERVSPCLMPRHESGVVFEQFIELGIVWL